MSLFCTGESSHNRVEGEENSSNLQDVTETVAMATSPLLEEESITTPLLEEHRTDKDVQSQNSTQ